MAKMYVFGGGKGGVGKTTATLAMHHAKRARGEDYLLVDGDSTNPDVARALGLEAPENFCDPLEPGSWRQLLAAARERDVVVNLPAGGDKYFLGKSQLISNAASEDGIQLFYISTLNRTTECLSLLKSSLEMIETTTIKPVVVINEFFGAVYKFERYQRSAERKKIRQLEGIEIVLPELVDFATDAMISPGGVGFQQADAMTRHAFQEWVDAVTQKFNF